MNDLDRQTSWVTRASATKMDSAGRVDNAAPHYVQLLNQVPSVSQISFISAQGREELRLSRTGGISYGSTVDFSRDVRFTERWRAAPPVSRRSISATTGPSSRCHGAHRLQRRRRRRHVAEIDLRFLSDYLGDAQVGRNPLPMSSIPRGW